MIVGGCCISHTPLMGSVTLADPIGGDVATALDEAREFVAGVAPDLVIVFGVDHLNGFLYRLMPQFAVGIAARGIGDFQSAVGPISVDAVAADDLARAVLEAGVDVAVSAAMEVDHGFVQPLEVLLGAIDRCATVPIFVNAAGLPRAPLTRSALLGEAVGRWADRRPERVLLVGSGGLSHDPPVPVLSGANAELTARLLDGLTADARVEKETAISAAAAEFAAGGGPLRPLAPDFDRTFLRMVESGDLSALSGWDDDWLTEVGGRAVHEIRTWIAVAAAMATLPQYRLGMTFYREIPEWIAGFGLATFLGRAA